MQPYACVCLLVLLWFLPSVSAAQCPGVTVQQTPFAKETLTVSTTVKPLTQTIYKPSGVIASMAMLSIEGGAIRYQVVGSPTATDGHPVQGTPPQTLIVCGYDSIAAFRAIRETADATVYVTYYKNK